MLQGAYATIECCLSRGLVQKLSASYQPIEMVIHEW